MRFCQDHWDRLRADIDERGLSHLVAKGGEQAARNLASGIREGSSVKTFDPLMYAHMAIMSNAVERVGLAVFAPNEDGSDHCPLCFLNAEHERTCDGQPACRLPLINGYDGWLDHAADEAKEKYDELTREARPDA